MKKSRLLGALCATALVVLANISHAAVMNPLLGLNIGGTLYDVTFHDVDAVSFNALWDADNTGTIGSGSSVFSNPPTFWGDPTGAMQAAAAIIAALGTTDTTIAGSDGFVVPFGSSPSGETALSSFGDVIYYYTDSSPTLLGTDDLNEFSASDDYESLGDFAPIASFVKVVPVPATVWLFGSGLLGLVGMARRKKA